MTKMRTLLLSILLLAPLSVATAQSGLTVYPPVRDPDGSTHIEGWRYKVRVREDKPGSQWKNVYAMKTISKTAKPGESDKAYFGHLNVWTHTFVNFETDVPVLVEITDGNGYKIDEAAIHPALPGSAVKKNKNGTIEVKLAGPCLVAVDVHGQMDKQDTGMGYKGPPIHTISIFANPPLHGKPEPTGPASAS